VLNWIETLWLKLTSYFETNLPVGMTEFHDWAEKIIKLTGPLADVASMKYVLANQVLGLRPEVSKVPLNYFVKTLRKAAANQITSQDVQDIRAAQQEALKAAEALKAEAAAVEQAVVEDVKKI